MGLLGLCDNGGPECIDEEPDRLGVSGNDYFCISSACRKFQEASRHAAVVEHTGLFAGGGALAHSGGDSQPRATQWAGKRFSLVLFCKRTSAAISEQKNSARLR